MPNEMNVKVASQQVKDMVVEIGKHINQLGQNLGSRFKEIMGEEINEVLDWGRDIGGKLKDISQTFISPWLTIARDTILQNTLVKKSTEYLKGLFSIEKRREKRELTGQGMQGGGIKAFFGKLLDLLALPIAAAAAAGAAILRKIFAPFELILNGFAFLRNTKIIKDAIFKIKAFVLGSRRLSTWFLKAGDLLRKIGRLAIRISRWPGVRTILGGIRFGLKWIFWPLQILMSTIDFIKGFSSAQGDILEKIKGGLQNVVLQFFDLPILLLGKALDWIMNLFGKEDFGGANKIRDSIKWYYDQVFGMFRNVLDLFKFLFNKVGDLWDMLGGIRGIFDKILGVVVRIWDGAVEWLRTLVERAAGTWIGQRVFGDELEGLQKMISPDSEQMKKAQEERKAREERQLKLQEEMARYQKRMAEREDRNVVGVLPGQDRFIPQSEPAPSRRDQLE